MDKEQLFSVKADILDCGLDKRVRKANLLNFRYGDRSQKEALETIFGRSAIKITDNLLRARYKRFNRVREHISELLTLEGCNWLFVTLTFSDKTLASTTPQTRRRYVARWLKRVSPLYVANIDFGDENEREHYHAIICNFVDTDSRKSWNRYGIVNFKRIRLNEKSLKALPLYITKFTAHAMKESAARGNQRIIYSRKFKVNFSEVF